MSEQNIAFEKWKWSAKLKVKQPLIYETNLIKEAFNAGYKAATAEAEKRTHTIDAVKFQEALDAMCFDKDARIAELESEVAELKSANETAQWCVRDKNTQITELQAINNDLRKTLWIAYKWMPASIHVDGFENDMQTILKALPTTPAESLQAHDDDVIEKCAKVCDECGTAEVAARLIRDLKGKV